MTHAPNPNLPIASAVNEALRPLIGPFGACTASIASTDGSLSGSFGSVIHLGSNDADTVLAPVVAAVLVCEEALTIESLRAAYQRIHEAKVIPKPNDVGANVNREMTLGVVLGRNSALSLEAIAAEMARLNRDIPSQYWPDVVAVLGKGTIGYTTRIPGAANQQSGDMFLPAPSLVGHGPVASVVVSMYVRATGVLTFNKVISLILARIAIYQPGVAIPDYREFLNGIPSHGIIIENYQFRLDNTLREMTPEQSVVAMLPTDWFNVVSHRKEVLGSVQFRAWQDGGVIYVRGNFPIEMLLVFLRVAMPTISPAHLRFFRGAELQSSYVLPISRPQFLQALQAFEQRSNMRVRREEPKLVIQKYADEGTTSPFYARLMLGVLQIRLAGYADEKERNAFDELYEAVVSGLRNARDESRDLEKRWSEHRDRVASGQIVRVDRGSIYVDESIDRALRKDLESFLNTAVRVLKTSMQMLAKHHGVEIGFLFKKKSTFEAAIATLKLTDGVLAAYLDATRVWSEPLVTTRNDLEHTTIQSLRVTYANVNGQVEAAEPSFSGVPITQYVRNAGDRVSCFVEELTMYCLRTRFPESVELTEVSIQDRDATVPLRFHLTTVPGGLPPWSLVAHSKAFDKA